MKKLLILLSLLALLSGCTTADMNRVNRALSAINAAGNSAPYTDRTMLVPVGRNEYGPIYVQKLPPTEPTSWKHSN